MKTPTKPAEPKTRMDPNKKDPNKKDPDSYSNPSYDGRIQYHEMLGYQERVAVHAKQTKSYPEWADSLITLNIMVVGFIKDNKHKKIKQDLRDARKMAMRYEKIPNHKKKYAEKVRMKLQEKLEDIHEELYRITNHIHLPIVEAQEGDLDIEKFFKSSGLS